MNIGRLLRVKNEVFALVESSMILGQDTGVELSVREK